MKANFIVFDLIYQYIRNFVESFFVKIFAKRIEKKELTIEKYVMKRKYNIALTPINSDTNIELINIAQKLLNIADNYILNENSLPHITLCQFDTHESDIDAIWKKLIDTWQEKSINLEFTEFSFITFDNETHWISLLPNKSDILHKMHKHIAELLNLPVKKMFDPHMTLINTKNDKYRNEVEQFSKSYRTIKDDFILTLGISDNIGQLTHILAKCEI